MDIKRDAEAKACSECQTIKPLEAFGRQKKGKYGRRAKCKVCYNAREKEVRLRNTKHCSRCEENKPLDCFASSSVTKDGLYAWCRTCKRKADRQRQGENGKYQPGKEESVESIFAGYSDEEILRAVYKLQGKRKKVVCPGPGPCTKDGEKTKARLTSAWWPYCELHKELTKKSGFKKLRKQLELA